MDGSAARAAVEAGAGTLLIGALINALPPIAAAVAIVWYCCQIWESSVGQRWRRRWRHLLIDRQPLSAEDKLAFLLTGVGGTGVALVFLAIYRLMGVF